MANIPQALPNEEPKSYLGYSKPIEQPRPEVSTSLESLFKSIGTTLSGVAVSADTLIKDSARDGLNKDIDAERGRFTNELAQYSKDAGAPGQSGQQSSLQGNGMDAMAQDTGDDAEVPDEVTGIGDQVTNLTNARGAGKISPTQYWLAIDNIAKDYRARYAGHREFIDQTISSITGHNPANAYMSSIMSDLNYAMRGTAKVDPLVRQATGAVTELAKNGRLPDDKIAELYDKAQNHPTDAMRVVNAIMAPKNASDKTGWELNAQEGKIKEAALVARTVVPKYVTDNIWSHMEGNMAFGGETVSSIQKKMAEMATDPTKANPEGIQALGMKLMMLRQQSELENRKWLDAPVGPNGESRAQVASGLSDAGKYTNDLLREKYVPFDTMLKNLVGKDPSLAAYQTEVMQAQATNDQYNALKTDFGSHIRMMNLLQKYPKDMQEYMKTILAKDYGNANVNVFVKDTMASFMTARSEGKLVSIDDAIKKAKSAGIDDPKVFNDFAKFGEQILNPNLSTESKVNIAASMFNPKNFGFLSNFNDDKVIEDVNGVYRMVPGKFSVWQTYTSPAFAAQIKALSVEHPEVGVWYKNWVSQGFGSDIFGPQIKQLSQIAADPRVTLTYNNVTNTFNQPEQDTSDFWSRIGARTQRKSGAIDDMGQSITMLNEGLRGIANEAATRGITEPAAVQGYVLGQLKGLGFIPPQPRVVRDPKNITDQLVNAFLSAAKQFSPIQGKEKK